MIIDIKKINAMVMVTIAGAFCIGATANIALAGDAKTTICHYTGSASNPYVTLNVNTRAVKGHMAHGDSAGACEEGSSDPASCPCNELSVLSLFDRTTVTWTDTYLPTKCNTWFTNTEPASLAIDLGTTGTTGTQGFIYQASLVSEGRTPDDVRDNYMCNIHMEASQEGAFSIHTTLPISARENAACVAQLIEIAALHSVECIHHEQ